MVAKVRALGPLDMPGKHTDWDKEMEELEAHVNNSQKEIPAHVH